MREMTGCDKVKTKVQTITAVQKLQEDRPDFIRLLCVSVNVNVQQQLGGC